MFFFLIICYLLIHNDLHIHTDIIYAHEIGVWRIDEPGFSGSLQKITCFFGLLCDPDWKKILIISVPLMDNFWRHGQKKTAFYLSSSKIYIYIYNSFH